MKLPNIFRVLDPIPTGIILVVTLPFLFVGLSQVWKALELVNNFDTAPGIVIGNDYQTHTDSQDSAVIYSSYYPVVRFTTAQGRESIFTDGEGSFPAVYEVGEVVEVLYDPNDPADATIKSWLSIWFGPLWVTTIGLVPLLGIGVWAAWQYVRAERRMQASRRNYR